MRTISRNVRTAMTVSLFACVALSEVRPVWADDAPRSYIASPDVYRVIAENNKTRVILVSWKPGQRDAWHSHPANTAVYYLTDCEQRAYYPDGKFADGSRKAGSAFVQAAIQSHSVENRSSAECRIVLVEQE